MKLEWHIESRSLSELRGYDKNPRKLTKGQLDQLQKSIERFGLIDKPFINTDNVIIGGHQRVALLKRLGHETAEVYVPNRALTSKEVEELNIRHNQNSGSWDYDILANQFDTMELIQWGFSASQLLDFDEPQGKRLKPKATFEFDTHDALEDAQDLLLELAATWGAKLKIKR